MFVSCDLDRGIIILYDKKMNVGYNTDITTWYIVVDATGDDPYVGDAGSGYDQNGCGLRFDNQGIPAGATITSAYLKFTSQLALSTTVVNTYITGEKSVAGAAFSTLANYQGRRGTAVDGADDTNVFIGDQVAWDGIAAWSVDECGADTTSPDISSIIQLIIDQGGWTGESGGNTIVLYWDDHDGRSDTPASRVGYGYSRDSSKAAVLVVTFYCADSEQTIQPCEHDSQVIENAADTNYGSNVNFNLYDAVNAVQRSLLSFDVSSISIPEGRGISHVSMQLYLYNYNGVLDAEKEIQCKMYTPLWVQLMDGRKLKNLMLQKMVCN